MAYRHDGEEGFTRLVLRALAAGVREDGVFHELSQDEDVLRRALGPPSVV